MKEKILELLKTKFVGVSEVTLNRMAEKAAKTATTEELVQTYVDGVSFQNVIDSEADYRATKATQTSIENYEKKHNIKDGKPIQKKAEKQTDEDGIDDGESNQIPVWAKEIIEVAKALKEEKRASTVKSVKEKLIDKVIELGANKDDRKKIEKLMNFISIDENSDIEQKANEILETYNEFKTAPSTASSPGKSDDDIADDAFEEMLKGAKEDS